MSGFEHPVARDTPATFFLQERKGSKLMRFIVFFLSALLFPDICFAACASPAGQESQTRYDFATHKMFYCNGSDWVANSGDILGTLNCVEGESIAKGPAGWECVLAGSGPGDNDLIASLPCNEGQIPVKTSGGWGCADMPSGGSSEPTCPTLVTGGKSCADCALAGGTAYEISSGSYICYFPKALLKQEVIFFIPTGNYLCPDGWTKHANWSKTTAKSCSGGSCGSPTSCTTGQHDIANTAPESCSYKGKDGDNQCQTFSCKANIVGLGCI